MSGKFHKYMVILLLITLNILLSQSIDSLNVITNNLDNFNYKSNKFYLTYDSWGINGVFYNYGLPDFAQEHYYNGMKVDDPVLGKHPFPWFNTDYTTIKPKNNNISIISPFYDTEALHSEFSYFKGDYGFNRFSLATGRKVSSNFYWTLYGKNIAHDGYKGLYGKKYTQNGESLAQSYHLDFYFKNDHWNSIAGMSYNKYFPGLLAYEESNYGEESKYLRLAHNGKLKERKIRSYFTAQNLTKDSTKAGISFSNYYYLFSKNQSEQKQEMTGSVINFQFQRRINFGQKYLLIKLNPAFRDISSKKAAPIESKILKSDLSYSDSLLEGKAKFSLNFYNLKPGFQFTYLKKLLPLISLEINSKKKYFEYPLVYSNENYLQIETKEKFGHYYKNGLMLKLDSKYLNIDQGISQINANYEMPHKRNIVDTSIKLNTINNSQTYFYNKFSLTLPAGLTFDSKAFYKMNRTDEYLDFIGMGRMRHNLAPIFSGLSGLMPEYLGFFKNYFRQIEQNMIPYWSGEIKYIKGGDNIVWIQQLQNIGTSSTNYYTNNRFNINLKFGFRVKSFHFFYAIYNLLDRQYSTVGGMPPKGRQKVFGIRWSFLD